MIDQRAPHERIEGVGGAGVLRGVLAPHVQGSVRAGAGAGEEAAQRKVCADLEVQRGHFRGCAGRVRACVRRGRSATQPDGRSAPPPPVPGHCLCAARRAGRGARPATGRPFQGRRPCPCCLGQSIPHSRGPSTCERSCMRAAGSVCHGDHPACGGQVGERSPRSSAVGRGRACRYTVLPHGSLARLRSYGCAASG
jgi:hypothetical protein